MPQVKCSWRSSEPGRAPDGKLQFTVERRGTRRDFLRATAACFGFEKRRVTRPKRWTKVSVLAEQSGQRAGCCLLMKIFATKPRSCSKRISRPKQMDASAATPASAAFVDSDVLAVRWLLSWPLREFVKGGTK